MTDGLAETLCWQEWQAGRVGRARITDETGLGVKSSGKCVRYEFVALPNTVDQLTPGTSYESSPIKEPTS